MSKEIKNKYYNYFPKIRNHDIRKAIYKVYYYRLQIYIN